MGAYPYLGYQELWYQQYLDVDTGRMLVAEPADPPNTYNMTPVDGVMPVPPDDGKWGTELTTPPPLLPPPPPAPVISPPLPAPAPAPAPEGGDSA